QIDYRWGAGNADRIRKFAAELVALAPDVILASGSPSVAALQEATRTVPVVFVTVVDPVSSGFVDSLAQLGGNINGFATYDYSIWRKMVGDAQRDRAGRHTSGSRSGCRINLRRRSVGCHPGGSAIGRGGGGPNQYA